MTGREKAKNQLIEKYKKKYRLTLEQAEILADQWLSKRPFVIYCEGIRLT